MNVLQVVGLVVLLALVVVLVVAPYVEGWVDNRGDRS